MSNSVDREPVASSTLKYPGVRELVLRLRPKLRDDFQLGDAKALLSQVGRAMIIQGIPQHAYSTLAGIDIPSTPIGEIAIVLKENPELGQLLYNDLLAGFLHDNDYTPDISGRMTDRLAESKARKMSEILEAFGFNDALPVIESALVIPEHDLRVESIRLHGIQCFKSPGEMPPAENQASPAYYKELQEQTRASLKTRRMSQILANWFDLLLIRDVGVPLMSRVGFASMQDGEDPRDDIRDKVTGVME